MDEIVKCECPPGSKSNENEDGMKFVCHAKVGFKHRTSLLLLFLDTQIRCLIFVQIQT